jgi:Tol biopolymer transport system component
MTIAANPGGTGLSCSGRVADATAVGRGAALDVFTRKAIRGPRGVSIAVVRRRVATGPAIGNPAWSPDGRVVLFERADKIARSGSWIVSNLWVVGADGRGLRRLLPSANSVITAGVWSPDGRRILFQRYPQRGAFHQLVVNANGSGAHPVDDYSIPGVWSPDSRSIAFVGGNQGYGIALVDAATGAQTSVFNPSSGVFGQPVDWQALPGGKSVRCADRAPAAIP